MGTRTCLIPNPICGTIKTKTQHVRSKNPIGFYYNHETRTKQSYDKKTYSKFVLKRLTMMGYSIFIYTHWAFNSKKNFKKFATHMWPMCTHVWSMCGLCVPMCKL
jgi:hypothetical protein